MKTALISGVSGQDGAYLASLLLDKGYKVVGTSRDCQRDRFQNLRALGIYDQVDLHSMSLHDFRSVLTVLADVEPDEIYNLSGQASVGLSFQQPVETLESIATATTNLLECLRFLGSSARLYNAGSSECFGNLPDTRATEDLPFHPRSPYAVAKATAHWQVAMYRESYDLYCCTGILFNHESPLRPERYVTQKIITGAKRVAEGCLDKLTLGNLDIQRDWGWAPEYVNAMWLMLQQDEADDYVIATGHRSSLRDFLSEAFEFFDLDWQEHVAINESYLRPSDIASNCGDPGKARDRLGWEPSYKVNDVVRLMCEAVAANG
jgi:GDPmannose 4,6-dehydratase